MWHKGPETAPNVSEGSPYVPHMSERGSSPRGITT